MRLWGAVDKFGIELSSPHDHPHFRKNGVGIVRSVLGGGRWTARGTHSELQPGRHRRGPVPTGEQGERGFTVRRTLPGRIPALQGRWRLRPPRWWRCVGTGHRDLPGHVQAEFLREDGRGRPEPTGNARQPRWTMREVRQPASTGQGAFPGAARGLQDRHAPHSGAGRRRWVPSRWRLSWSPADFGSVAGGLSTPRGRPAPRRHEGEMATSRRGQVHGRGDRPALGRAAHPWPIDDGRRHAPVAQGAPDGRPAGDRVRHGREYRCGEHPVRPATSVTGRQEQRERQRDHHLARRFEVDRQPRIGARHGHARARREGDRLGAVGGSGAPDRVRSRVSQPFRHARHQRAHARAEPTRPVVGVRHRRPDGARDLVERRPAVSRTGQRGGRGQARIHWAH